MVITIAGGGSTFTAGIVKSIALRREELEVDEIRLFDINKERQDKVAVVVDWVLHKELNTDIKLVVTTDVQQAYTDTSFVFAQMRVGGYAMRDSSRIGSGSGSRPGFHRTARRSNKEVKWRNS